MVFFPGKIFGIHANYIIAEVEFFEGEDPEEPLDDERQQEQQEVNLLGLNSFFGLVQVFLKSGREHGKIWNTSTLWDRKTFLAEWGSISWKQILLRVMLA